MCIYEIYHNYILCCLFQILEMLRFTPGKTDDAMPPLDDLLTPPSKGDNFGLCDTPLAADAAGMETDLNGSFTGVSR